MVCARGWQGRPTIMRSKGWVLSTTPHMLMEMGAVALPMRTCKGDGKGGKHCKDKVGGVAGKVRKERDVAIALLIVELRQGRGVLTALLCADLRDGALEQRHGR